jgi:hypothetical protein
MVLIRLSATKYLSGLCIGFNMIMTVTGHWPTFFNSVLRSSAGPEPML